MRIGLVGDNSLEFVELLLKIWSDSNCAVIIDWRMPACKIDELLIEAGVESCFIDVINFKEDIYHKSSIQYIPYKKNSDVVVKLPEEIIEQYHSEYNDDEALILYSSGTTGKNKGIILTYAAINLNADSICDYMKLSSSDSIYILKTLSHSSTIVGELLVALKSGSDIYISSTIVPAKYSLDNINDLGITTFCANPALLSLYSKSEKLKPHTFPMLKTIYTSGSILEKENLQFIQNSMKKVKILNVYGLTEAGPRVTAQTLMDDNIDGSVGKPINGVKVKIVKKTDIQNSNYGVVYVKTPSAFKGYISGNYQKMDEEGWIDTGDIGYLDESKNLFIVGRYDNMMLIGSHNVYPESLESTIYESGLIDDCIVYSVKNNNLDERIVCKYTASKDVCTELRDYCISTLAPYEVPQTFIKVQKIESTCNGKKSRRTYVN